MCFEPVSSLNVAIFVHMSEEAMHVLERRVATVCSLDAVSAVDYSTFPATSASEPRIASDL